MLSSSSYICPFQFGISGQFSSQLSGQYLFLFNLAPVPREMDIPGLGNELSSKLHQIIPRLAIGISEVSAPYRWFFCRCNNRLPENFLWVEKKNLGPFLLLDPLHSNIPSSRRPFTAQLLCVDWIKFLCSLKKEGAKKTFSSFSLSAQTPLGSTGV